MAREPAPSRGPLAYTLACSLAYTLACSLAYMLAYTPPYTLANGLELSSPHEKR